MILLVLALLAGWLFGWLLSWYHRRKLAKELIGYLKAQISDISNSEFNRRYDDLSRFL